MPQYKVSRTFKSDGGTWYSQGDMVTMVADTAKHFVSARVLVPVLTAVKPPTLKKPVVEMADKKPVVEMADKKPAEENAVSAKIPRRG